MQKCRYTENIEKSKKELKFQNIPDFLEFFVFTGVAALALSKRMKWAHDNNLTIYRSKVCYLSRPVLFIYGIWAVFLALSTEDQVHRHNYQTYIDTGLCQQPKAIQEIENTLIESGSALSRNLVPEQFKENQRLNRRLVTISDEVAKRMDVSREYLEERRQAGQEYEDHMAEERAKAELDLVKQDKDSFIMKYLRQNDIDTRKKIAQSVISEFQNKNEKSK